MKFFARILAIVLLAVGSAGARAGDYYLDAMSFAIAHFDSKHEKGIESWSPEHRFMHNLLNAVAKAVPEIAGISNQKGRGGGYQDPFGFLTRDVFVKAGDDESRELVERLKQHVDTIVEGCEFDRTTVLEERHGKKYSKKTKIVTSYVLDPERNTDCRNLQLARQLSAIKLKWLVTVENLGPYGDSLQVNFGRNNGTAYDMEFIRKQALSIDAVKDFISELKANKGRGVLIGRRGGIRLQSTGNASFKDPVKLRYWKGWGDCAAGCINNRYWNVLVTPKPRGDKKFDFEVAVTTEEGDRLPKRRPKPSS